MRRNRLLSGIAWGLRFGFGGGHPGRLRLERWQRAVRVNRRPQVLDNEVPIGALFRGTKVAGPPATFLALHLRP